MQEHLLELFYKNRNSPMIESEGGDKFYYLDVLTMLEHKNVSMLSRSLVMAIIDNEPGGILNYIVLLAAGSVPMLVSPSLSESAINNLVSTYRPRYLLVAESTIANFRGAKVKYRKLGYVLLDCGPSFGLDEIYDELALLLSTSGSTGSVKYVRLSHRNVWSNANAISEYLGLNKTERPITVLPPTYSYGLSVIHSHILVGACLAVTRASLFDKKFWDFFSEKKASSFAGVPYHYQILKKLRFTNMDFPHLRTLTQAGGHMSQELVMEFANYCMHKNIRFYVMYGQTEASPRMSYVPPEQAFSKAGTIGLPITGGNFKLRSEDGTFQNEAGSTGELVYYGPNVCLGYAKSAEELSLGDINGGVLYTGDFAERDVDGYYRIIGRQKRFIKFFGNRISLEEVEQSLSNHCIEIACAGRDDNLEIYLVGSNAEQGILIKQSLMENLRVGAQGITIYKLDALPRNESGKVKYAELSSEKALRIV